MENAWSRLVRIGNCNIKMPEPLKHVHQLSEPWSKIRTSNILFNPIVAIGVPRHLVESWPKTKSCVWCISLSSSSSLGNHLSGRKTSASSPKPYQIVYPMHWDPWKYVLKSDDLLWSLLPESPHAPGFGWGGVYLHAKLRISMAHAPTESTKLFYFPFLHESQPPSLLNPEKPHTTPRPDFTASIPHQCHINYRPQLRWEPPARLRFRLVLTVLASQCSIITRLPEPFFETQSFTLHRHGLIKSLQPSEPASVVSTTWCDIKLCEPSVTSVDGIHCRWYLFTIDPNVCYPSVLCQSYHYEKNQMGRWCVRLPPWSLHQSWYGLG